MEIDAGTLSPQEAYRLLVGLVVPRPIAWVTTQSSAGVVNLAPFSCFTFVSYSPPMVAISVGRRGEALKDTARNIMESKAFVVNIVDEPHIEQMHLSSAEHPAEVGEAALLGLKTEPSHSPGCHRLSSAPAALECMLYDIIEFGALRTQLIVGEIRHFHIRDGLCRDGKIDSRELAPVGRVAGPRYAMLREFISLPPTGETFG